MILRNVYQNMIKHIFIFNNEAVAVCDDRGRQIPSLQGDYKKIKPMIDYLIEKYHEVIISK